MTKEEIKENIFKLIERYFNTNDSISKTIAPKIRVASPCFNELEIISALDSLLELKISQGEKVYKFENKFSKYINKKYGVAVNSGSSANLLAISALIESGSVKKGSEVIVPSATFTTVVSPIIQCGLIPVFVDIELDTYNACPKEIEKAVTKDTGLIMVVHSMGCPANMIEIIEIANKNKIPVLEDCCEAHGASINNSKVGSFGLISTFSFFVAHNMTTGEGGMILTNDEQLNDLMKSMREFGRKKIN